MSTTANTENHLSSTKMESAQGSKGQIEGTATSGPSAQLTTTKERAAETDLLVYDVYMSNKFEGLTLDLLEKNIRAITLEHVKWAENFCHMMNDPAMGVHRIRILCLLQNSDETTLLKVEDALKGLQWGNHACVSSTAFRGYTKAF